MCILAYVDFLIIYVIVNQMSYSLLCRNCYFFSLCDNNINRSKEIPRNTGRGINLMRISALTVMFIIITALCANIFEYLCSRQVAFFINI